MTVREAGWTAIVPVKAWRSAKSRVDMPSGVREELARAMTLDTLDMLSSHSDIARVVVVTADADAAREARARDAIVLSEPPSPDPLNDAVRRGCAFVPENGPAVVVPADLAYLSADVLSAALAELAEHDLAHVPDLQGTGTTLLAARRASDIQPRYGIGSSELHARAGFTRLHDVDPRARADIDQLRDLTHHASWVPGPHVSGVLSSV